ncbi:hypothetical protein JCM3774_005762 [Rhodotorula dairenensis]
MPAYMDVPNIRLNHGGHGIPAVGLGTWKSGPGEVAFAVKTALQNGYKHLDLAWIYNNEREVGEGIRASGVPRREIFITSKLWCTKHRNVEAAVRESLELIGTDYLDLYLMHWPVPLNPNGNDPKFPKKEDGSRDLDTEWTINQTWAQMEALLEKGLVKGIGVSNFSEPMLDDLLKTAKVMPAANQVELHPYLPQHELLEYMHEKGIVAEAYSPLGSSNSPLLNDEDIQRIADKHGVRPGTILISYQVNRNVVVLPKSVTEQRIIENLKIVQLDPEDMELLNSLHKTKGQRLIKPDWGMDLKFKYW